MLGGEQLGHEAAFRRPQERRPFQPSGVHDGEDVACSLLKGGCVVELVRQPDPPLVERSDPDVAADVLEESPVELMLPDDLHIRHQRRDGENVWTRPPLLPCDPDTLSVSEADLRNVH